MFEGNKTNSTINVTAPSVVYGNASQIVVNVSVNTGYVRIIIPEANINEIIEIVGGIARFNATGLDVGRYYVNVTFIADDTYSTSENFTYFNVTKANITAVVVGQNVTVKDNIAFVIDNVTKGFAGKVNITVNGTSYDDVVKAYIEMGKLPAGNYTAKVTFYGDDNYNNLTMDVKFTVSRIDPTISVLINDTTYPDKAVCEINITDMANGTVKVIVDDKVFNGTVENGKALVDITGLSGGVKEAEIRFISTDKYNNDLNATAKFVVNKADSTVVITNTSATVIATVSENATGTVTFYVNGVEHNATINNGVAVWENVLDIGNNTVVAIYNGDVNFTSSRNSTNFTVGKAKSLVNVTVNETVYGNNVIIEVTVPLNQTGFVTINVNNKNYTAHVKDGKAVFNVTDLLDVAEYKVNVTYLEDDTFLANDNFTYFNVTKAEMSANVTAQNVTVEDNVPFIIDNVTAGFNGKVIIKVGDDKYYDDIVKAYIEIAKFTAGTYAANVTFYGDNNYNDRNYTVKFTVFRVTPEINVTIADVTYPNNASAIIIVSNNANGTVEIYEGTKLVGTGSVSDGKATVELITLPGGVHEVAVKFITSDDYNNNASAAAKFEVIKAASTVVITNASTTVIATVGPAGTTGNVTFYINGVKYAEVAIDANGQATVSDVLVIGNNTVVAIYNGDVNYTGSENNTNFTVGKAKSLVNVTVNETVYGNNVIIEVNVPLNQTGFVTINVNDKNYTAKVENGKAVFNVTGLKVAEYRVNVTYLEDDTFLANDNFTYFNVTKAEMSANVTAQNVTVEDNVPFIIDNVTSDFNGKVIIKVGDNKYYDDIVKAYAEIAKFRAGTYAANVTFYGDNNYNDRNYTVYFTVFRVTPEINVTVADVTYPNNACAIVNVSNMANGTVKVYLDNVEIGSGEITNGKAVINLTSLSGGVHEVVVKFITSDDYNNNVSTTAKFEVFKAVPTIVLTHVNNTVIATVTPEGATGNVTFIIRGEETTEVIVGGNATVEGALRNFS